MARPVSNRALSASQVLRQRMLLPILLGVVVVVVLLRSRYSDLNELRSSSYSRPLTISDIIERTSLTELEERMTGEKTKLPFSYDIDEYKRTKRVPHIYTREHLANILEYEGHKSGAELGVLRGSFAREILTTWTSAELYLLVDAWEPLENYLDASFGDAATQDVNQRTAFERTAQWKNKIEVCANYTTVCAAKYKDKLFDYVYVDARHDYKGVMLDLEDWWPLVREGGILAGHDYVFQEDGPKKTAQNWTVNYDGTVDELGRAVKGAVREFFGNPDRPDRFRVVHLTKRQEMWPSWIVRK